MKAYTNVIVRRMLPEIRTAIDKPTKLLLNYCDFLRSMDQSERMQILNKIKLILVSLQMRLAVLC